MKWTVRLGFREFVMLYPTRPMCSMQNKELKVRGGRAV